MIAAIYAHIATRRRREKLAEYLKQAGRMVYASSPSPQRGLALAATSRLRKPWGDKVAHCLQYEHPGVRGEEKADKECDVAKHAPGAGRADPGEPVSRQRMENGRGLQQPSASFSSPAGLDDARQDAEGEGGQHKESDYQHGSGTGWDLNSSAAGWRAEARLGSKAMNNT